MSKHTPEPWNNYEGEDIYGVYSNDGKKICVVEPVDIIGWNAVFREEAEANQALIAAAPDLLAALEEVMDCWLFGCAMPEKKAAIDQARAALAKARGEI